MRAASGQLFGLASAPGSCDSGRGSVLARWTARAASRLLPALALAAALTSRPARAQAPPAAERLHVYSPYEQQTIDEVMAARHLSRDPSPEGKTVERVDIVPLDVFEKRDVLPRWLNVFHVTSRESIIRREVLLREGGRYEQALVDDTIRNLRRLPGVPQLSAVLVVAAQGSHPDRVVLLVITKDVWSLRLNWNLVGSLSGFDQLAFQPSETNFLGTHQIVGATFILEPSAYTMGLQYFVPRLGHTRITAQAFANVMVNRDSGSVEGSYGSIVAGEPLYSGKTEWAWDATNAWQDIVARRYENAALATYFDKNAPNAPGIPFEFRSRDFVSSYELTRSFGWDTNHDFTLGANLAHAVYRATPPAGADPQVVADFTSQAIPVSDTRVGPSLQYHTYRMRFVRVVDFDTLALQEDYRLGHEVVLRVFPSFRAIGSTRDVVSFFGAAQYTWAVRDGLFRAAISSDNQAQVDRIADAYLQPTLHLVTPTIPGLQSRIVLDGSFLYRWRNYLNQIAYEGGDDRIRGYPTNFLVGANVLTFNVELRTRPVEILSCQVAGVAFFDNGDAYTSSYQTFQSVGLGMRALFPWLDRTVFRLDVGFPFERLDPSVCPGPECTRIPPYALLVSFGQAFGTPTIAPGVGVPPASPAPVLPTGQGPDAP
jgi:hypothetical protein